jgi:hypothetical protein
LFVTELGVVTTTFNVDNSGEAFNVADNSLLAVLDLLFATNDNTVDGVLYDTDVSDASMASGRWRRFMTVAPVVIAGWVRFGQIKRSSLIRLRPCPPV